MILQELIDFCLKKYGAYVDFPFGDNPVCIKVQKKIFAQIFTYEDDYKITLKCNPDLGTVYRKNYPETILPGYHLPVKQKKHWNTILLGKVVPEKLIREMISHSYDEVMKKLLKRRKR